jgi:acyl-CoA thioester hydrolase
VTSFPAAAWQKIMVRVYYEDTDFSGIVYHANFLKFAERGRSEYLRAIGIKHRDLAERDPPLAFAVTEMTVKFIQPARIDDDLEVATRFYDIRGARLRAEQVIFRGNEVIWHAALTAASIDFDGKPRRLPSEMVALFDQQPIVSLV